MCQDPGRLAWEVPGPTEVRFKRGEMVSKVFPGLLTVSLLAVEGLPTVLVRVFKDKQKWYPVVAASCWLTLQLPIFVFPVKAQHI